MHGYWANPLPENVLSHLHHWDDIAAALGMVLLLMAAGIACVPFIFWRTK